MKPIISNLTGAGDHVIRLNNRGRVGVAYSADVAVVVKPLANKDDNSSVIATIASATAGNFNYPADGLLVTTTTDTVLSVIQYGS